LEVGAGPAVAVVDPALVKAADPVGAAVAGALDDPFTAVADPFGAADPLGAALALEEPTAVAIAADAEAAADFAAEVAGPGPFGCCATAIAATPNVNDSAPAH